MDQKGEFEKNAQTVEGQGGFPLSSKATTDARQSTPTKNKEKAPRVKDYIPVEIWAQSYHNLEGKRTPYATLMVRENYKNFVLVERGTKLIILAPICFEDNHAFKPANFERLLRGIKNRFNHHKIHFAVLMTDELNRHNWAKIEQNKNIKEDIFENSDSSSDNETKVRNSPRIPKCLKSNLRFVEQARQESAEWLEEVKLDENSIKDTEKRLGCNITLFFWKEVMSASATDLRQLFCDRMGIENDPTKIPVDAKFLETQELAQFVEQERKQKRAGQRPEQSYCGIIDSLQNARRTKEIEKYPNLSDKQRRKCDDAYLGNETVGFMRIIGALGDLIQIFAQPELQLPDQRQRDKRTRITPLVEWLDWQSRELLRLKLDIDFQKSGEKNTIDLYGNHLYRFITAGYFPAALINADGTLNGKRLPQLKPDTDPSESDESATSKRSSDAMKDPNAGSPNKSPSKTPRYSVERLDDQSPYNTTPPDSPTRLSRYQLIRDAATMVAQASERDLAPEVRQHIKEFGRTAIRTAFQLDADEITILSEAAKAFEKLSLQNFK